MPAKLQLKFDPNQDYQTDAIESVVRVFDGLPRYTSEFALGDDVVPNLPAGVALSEPWLRDNVQAIQQANGLETPALLAADLEVEDGMMLDGVSIDSHRYPNFTVEMETGTGKTYVYLRTIHELRKHYGFRKFIIVVPSIPIYEGVVKHFDITKAHFRSLYGNEPAHPIRYDGSRLSKLRDFAISHFVEILVMTLDSFNRRTNTLYRPSEQLPGERLPYQYIQDTRPILILDEPQNMESEKARAALRTLRPLFALRYSATHRTSPNLVYQLTPFDAFRRGLVKRIQVDGVTERDDFNRPFLALQSIQRGAAITAKVRTYVADKGRTREAEIVLRQGDDLQAKTGREEHADGYRVVEIHAGAGYVDFENGIRLHLQETIGPARPDIFRVQIERTVERHMQWQDQMLERGIKVLSLFFIDRVANYTAPNGIIKSLFDAAFEKYKRRFPHFARFDAAQVRDAYFATQKAKGATEEEAVDTSSRTVAEREAEKRAFQLIMRDKEQLLSLDEPVSFIFAHSALKEGWDNPNVFQICTLNQTISIMKKRQEIGRGLRLAVDQQGDRIFDESVNVLTVVANESYERYASTLQSEYTDDGQLAPPKPTQVGKATASRRDDHFTSSAFRAFWDRLCQQTRYVLHVDTPTLIDICVERLNNATIPEPRIVVQRGQFVMTEIALILEEVRGSRARIRIAIHDTLGHEDVRIGTYEIGTDLARVHHEPRLKGLKISTITAGPSPSVLFDDGTQLALGTSLIFQAQSTQVPVERTVLAHDEIHPVPNLLDRAAKETGLTRTTVNAIFRRISDRQKAKLFRNPEGFATLFLTELQNALADHIVDHLEFVVTGPQLPNLEKLFPPSKAFPQRELVDAGPRGLYDRVQTDSDVEQRFVEWRLRDSDQVVWYFKFPPEFKVPLPKILGNYNPDWGILRLDDAGQPVLQLVRETKGSEELRALQFPHERRKVLAAQKHFRTIGVDYRVVTDQTPYWWLPGDALPVQMSLGSEPGGGSDTCSF